MKKKFLDDNLELFSPKTGEEYEVSFKIKKNVFFYKLLLLGVILLASCSRDGIEIKSREISLNLLDKHKIAEIYGIDVFKDTLLYIEDGKYTYDYTKFKDSLNIENKIEKLNNWIDKFPPDFLEKMNLDEVFIQKKIVRTSKKKGKKTTLTGLYFAKNDNLSLTDMDEFPHELSHKIDDFFEKDDADWGNVIYGDSYEDFYGEPQKNSKGYYSRKIGFLNANSQRSIQEDRAEILHDLMTKDIGAMFLNDKILQKKRAQMKKELFELDSRFNDQYWKDLKKGIINKEYWKYFF